MSKKLYLLGSVFISSFLSSSDEVSAKSIDTGIPFSFSISTSTNSAWFGVLFKWLRINQTCLTPLLVCISTLYVEWWASTILHGPFHLYFSLARSLRGKWTNTLSPISNLSSLTFWHKMLTKLFVVYSWFL